MSCADVCIDRDDRHEGDNPFYRETQPVARKSHTCCECGREIAAGQRYERAVGKTDDSVFSVATCGPCAAIRDALVCGSFVYGELWESIEEEVFPVWLETGPWDCLTKIENAVARSELSSAFRKYKDTWAPEREAGWRMMRWLRARAISGKLLRLFDFAAAVSGGPRFNRKARRGLRRWAYAWLADREATRQAILNPPSNPLSIYGPSRNELFAVSWNSALREARAECTEQVARLREKLRQVGGGAQQ